MIVAEAAQTWVLQRHTLNLLWLHHSPYGHAMVFATFKVSGDDFLDKKHDILFARTTSGSNVVSAVAIEHEELMGTIF